MQLNLEPQEVDFVMNVIAQQPYNQVAGLLQKIQGQIQGQLEAVPPLEEDHADTGS